MEENVSNEVQTVVQRSQNSFGRTRGNTATGYVVQGYQLGDKIGRGQYGCVFKAINVQTGTFVALKQLSISDITTQQLPGLKREVELLQQLEHPNIVKVHKFFETADSFFFVMDYIENGSLAQVVNKFGPLPESLAAIYVKQALSGLDYLHSNGIVHRDIKGANVLLTKEGTVVLADFGLALNLLEQSPGAAPAVVGTPYWVAPEIILMEGHGVEADIWSLGCTIVELITGAPPYFDLPSLSAIFKMVNDDLPPLPDGSADLCDFLTKCFEKDPKKRPSAFRLLRFPWIIANTVGVGHSQRKVSLQDVEKEIKIHRTSRGNINVPEEGATRPKKSIKREDSEILFPLLSESQHTAIDLIAKLQTKLEQIDRRTEKYDRRWRNLISLEKVMKKVNSPKDSAALSTKVEAEKQKTERVLSELTEHQKMLMLQLIELKKRMYPRLRAIKDHYFPEFPDLLYFSEGQELYLVKEDTDGLWIGEMMDNAHQGLIKPSYVEVINQGASSTENDGGKDDLLKSNVYIRNQRRSTLPDSVVIDEAASTLAGVQNREKLYDFFGESKVDFSDSFSSKKGKKDKKQKKEKKKTIQKLKERIHDLETQVKEYERKYIETKMLLSRTQMENADLQLHVWELKKEQSNLTTSKK